MSVNKAIIIGNVGTAKPGEVFKFTVATGEKWKDKSGVPQERTEWHTVTMFGEYGQKMQQYITKGMKVFVEGQIRTNTYEKDGQKHFSTEIIAQKVEMLSPKEDKDSFNA